MQIRCVNAHLHTLHIVQSVQDVRADDVGAMSTSQKSRHAFGVEGGRGGVAVLKFDRGVSVPLSAMPST